MADIIKAEEFFSKKSEATIPELQMELRITYKEAVRVINKLETDNKITFKGGMTYKYAALTSDEVKKALRENCFNGGFCWSDDLKNELKRAVRSMRNFEDRTETFSAEGTTQYPDGTPFRFKVVKLAEKWYIVDMGRTIKYIKSAGKDNYGDVLNGMTVFNGNVCGIEVKDADVYKYASVLTGKILDALYLFETRVMATPEIREILNRINGFDMSEFVCKGILIISEKEISSMDLQKRLGISSFDFSRLRRHLESTFLVSCDLENGVWSKTKSCTSDLEWCLLRKVSA